METRKEKRRGEEEGGGKGGKERRIDLETKPVVLESIPLLYNQKSSKTKVIQRIRKFYLKCI